jgi:serine/threonine protein kinase
VRCFEYSGLNMLVSYRFAMDIAQALNFLHKALLVHLDLKPANVIIGANDTCKLGDFGCCQVKILKATPVSGKDIESNTCIVTEPTVL